MNMTCTKLQGPQSSFEIGGTISDSILGGGRSAKHFFLLILYNFKNIGGGGMCPPPHSAVPEL